MPDPRDNAAIDRTVAEYGRVRVQLATYLAEASNLGDALRGIAITLPSGKVSSDFDRLPTPEQLHELAEDIRRLKERKLELWAELESLGYPPASS